LRRELVFRLDVPERAPPPRPLEEELRVERPDPLERDDPPERERDVEREP
jgi:hypothetical protein